VAVYEAVFGAKLRSNLKYFYEYVWIEITESGRRFLLIGNY
jgi:hypothetical protein